ncbi:MAG: sn-glycerol-3-phosphate ABC transporter ATP-binding protein UgpC [Lentisphaerae bacterium]|nr:MAG: sn-glycerol-3-phosphate ABC transporter ATP-binding protein UgpC [Lentisphaerota bacterium]
MANVTFTNVCKVYDNGFQAVKDFNLEINDGEFIVLVGPSGCGKSTSLRMVAGLEEISSGTIAIDGKVVNNVAPKDRDIAMVFQDYALYPHMTVYDNMAFGLKLRKYPKSEIHQRVHEAAQILGIEELLDRRPRQLSGGQRQRVAVGRAIVRHPKVFLFDEPLSNLDAKMRVQMRVEINRLHNRLKTTMIYVTHDQVEAMTMGDRIVVMKDGVIQQVADPITLYDQPANKFVAGFIGTPPMNFFDVRLVKNDSLIADGASFQIPVPEQFHEKLSPFVDKNVILGIRPEDIGSRIAEMSENMPKIQATVEIVEPMGAESYVYLRSGEHTFISRVDAHRKLHPNDDVELAVYAPHLHFFDAAASGNPAIV